MSILGTVDINLRPPRLRSSSLRGWIAPQWPISRAITITCRRPR